MTSRRTRLRRTQVAGVLVLAIIAAAVGLAARASGDKDASPPHSTAPRATAKAARPAASTTPVDPRAPASRRLEVTFVTSFHADDYIAVEYFGHGTRHKRVYKCYHPKEKYTTYIGGFSETWTSVGTCSDGNGHHNAFEVEFNTPYVGKDNLFVRIWYTPERSYRFSCINPGALTRESANASYETRISHGVCYVDHAVPETDPCGRTDQAPPEHYDHVVVIMEENRTWSQVGGLGFGAMPYAAAMAKQCAYYAQWHETNPRQKSLPQYIGLTSGVDNPHVYNDCAPSETCRSYDPNIFRQVREAGKLTRSYVENAVTTCNGSIHRANVPALYYFGGDDHSFCNKEVLPLAALNPDRLPNFAMITPSRCNNGHSCGNDVVDGWLRAEIGTLIGGESYKAGKTAIFVIYDEDRPMPNLVIAPTARPGEITSMVASHNDALRTFEELLDLPILPTVKNAVSLRASAHI